MHLIEVLYDDAPVPKSPFRVSVVEGCDPTRVRAYGPGLEGGITNKPNCFTVETRYCWVAFKGETCWGNLCNKLKVLVSLSGVLAQEAWV